MSLLRSAVPTVLGHVQGTVPTGSGSSDRGGVGAHPERRRVRPIAEVGVGKVEKSHQSYKQIWAMMIFDTERKKRTVLARWSGCIGSGACVPP